MTKLRFNRLDYHRLLRCMHDVASGNAGIECTLCNLRTVFLLIFFTHYTVNRMIHPEVLELLNAQMNKEFYSWYLYLSVSTYFNSQDLEGFEQWTNTQAQEELMHGMKIYNYILERKGSVDFRDIHKPSMTWASPVEAVSAIYEHERSLSQTIHQILKVAREHADYSAEVFLHWFITEQLEEEVMADRVLQKLKMVGDNSGALLMLDSQITQIAAAASARAAQNA
ncbi:MAG TPA: ferritin [Candidatus Kapabacteria bacterium]|nr:ferritin [Candidatus Kapabacteria bacterium]